jgi:hypothetical protein
MSKRRKSRVKTRKLPKLRKSSNKNKKHKYKLKYSAKKRRLAIHEGINYESKTGKNIKKAALSKKKRLNVLRIYRRNSNKVDCNKITDDMKYIDKKYKVGKTKDICGGSKKFLYNPNNPSRSFDVYIDKDPSDTIPIKYKNIEDVKDTIKKLEKLYKEGKYPHKRIWQVGMIMYVRLKVLKKKKPKEFKLSERYFKHLGKRTKVKGDKERKNFKFIF